MITVDSYDHTDIFNRRTAWFKNADNLTNNTCGTYRGAGKSLARPGRKQSTATDVLIFMYPTYNHNWRNNSTIYIYNKTSIKRNILTIKQNTSGSRSG